MNKKRVAGVGVVIVVAILVFVLHLTIGNEKTTAIGSNVSVIARHSLFGQVGANVVIYTDNDETVVVDTQLPPLASMTRSSIEENSGAPISTVFITHWHPDHSGGISAYSEEIRVIAHENVLRRLSETQEGFGLTKPGSHHEFAPRDAHGLPNETILGHPRSPGEFAPATAIHYANAHTDGDLVIYFEAQRVVAIGDLVWPGSFPFVDIYNGGSVAGLESALDSIIMVTGPEYHFVPGHGSALTHGELQTYLEMIRHTRHWVEGRINDGKTLEQIVASDLPDEWLGWGSALVPTTTWIETVFQSMSNLP